MNNIITIQFDDSKSIRTRYCYQYDKGQILQFKDIEDGIEIQFTNNIIEKTINKVIKNNQVNIPDILLSENNMIYAYVKIIETNNETTVKTIEIPIKKRVEPSDYVSKDDEQTFREYVEEKLDENKHISESIREDADKGKFNGKDGKDGQIGELTEEDKQNIVKNIKETITQEGYITDKDYNHTDNNYTKEDKEKLDDLENYNDTEIQSNVSQLKEDISTLNSTKANKTDISTLATKTYVDNLFETITNGNEVAY